MYPVEQQMCHMKHKQRIRGISAEETSITRWISVDTQNSSVRTTEKHSVISTWNDRSWPWIAQPQSGKTTWNIPILQYFSEKQHQHCRSVAGLCVMFSSCCCFSMHVCVFVRKRERGQWWAKGHCEVINMLRMCVCFPVRHIQTPHLQFLGSHDYDHTESSAWTLNTQSRNLKMFKYPIHFFLTNSIINQFFACKLYTCM